jgi:WD40 repeat protein
VSQSHTLTLYDVTSNAPVATFTLSTTVDRLALSPDGARLAAGLSSGTVILWNGRTGECIASLGGYASEGGQLEFSPNGSNLAFLSDDHQEKRDMVIKGNFFFFFF